MARRGEGIYLRGKSWWLDFRHNGSRHVVRLGKNISRTTAGELATVKRGEVLKGEAGIGRKRRDLLFDKAAEDFLRWAQANKRPNTIRSYRHCVAQLRRSFSGKRMGEIHTFLVEKYKRARIEKGAIVAANRELTCLKTLFNRCRDWGLFEGENPVRRVKLVKEPKGRLRYLEPEEEARLLATLPEPLGTIILSGIYAGLRIQAEALTLRKPDVNLQRGLLTVQAAYAKSGETRTIPLNSTLREALRRVMADSRSDYVFIKRNGTPYRTVRTAFQSACRRAGLKDVTVHTCRHTFASRLVMSGVDLRTIQELGGWSQLAMVERYAHLSPSHKAEAVERIAQKNSPTVFTTPQNVVELSARDISAAHG